VFLSSRNAASVCLLAVLATGPLLTAQVPTAPDGRAALAQQLDAIFNKHAYSEKSVQLAWRKGGDSYTILEPDTSGKGMDLVAYETKSGQRAVLVEAAQLRPSPTADPLAIWSYSWSADEKKLLIFTNARRVWRQFTRGDYFVYDTTSTTPDGKLFKLGGDAPASTMMFATFSPDGSRVAWVRENNLYVEELATRKITQLTKDGSADIINGTSDWVTEEELFLRDCYRWSPDSQSIAYWQFDQSGEGEYTLINDTDQEYPVTTKYKYPQAGTTNAAVRVGIVAAAGGETRWIKLTGDPRNNYVAQMDWAGDSNGVLLQYLDRHQQRNQFLWADAKTGETRSVAEDTDKRWVDVFPMAWIDKDPIFSSERDGWRHAFRVDVPTGHTRLITNFEGDVLEKAGVDQAAGWFYFLASPGDATRQYLYRSHLDGAGKPERVTPADQPGHHEYDISPNGRWAQHTFGTADRPVTVEIISLPDHKPVRTLVGSDELTEKIKPLLSSQTEFFQVKVDNGVTLDGSMIKPPNFDPAKKYPVLTYVYGEPWVAEVRDEWKGALRLFHGAVAEQGYIILNFDNQGTPAPKGREWRKCVYGSIGVLSSAQQAQAIKALAAQHPYIDTSRMAIWGWSGGGSSTLNVMLRYPGVYSTGIAVAPVADESHYDTIYQERYMGLPEENKRRATTTARRSTSPPGWPATC
jgi:dipeptidyl-peptidase-4